MGKELSLAEMLTLNTLAFFPRIGFPGVAKRRVYRDREWVDVFNKLSFSFRVHGRRLRVYFDYMEDTKDSAENEESRREDIDFIDYVRDMQDPKSSYWRERRFEGLREQMRETSAYLGNPSIKRVRGALHVFEADLKTLDSGKVFSAVLVYVIKRALQYELKKRERAWST